MNKFKVGKEYKLKQKWVVCGHELTVGKYYLFHKSDNTYYECKSYYDDGIQHFYLSDSQEFTFKYFDIDSEREPMNELERLVKKANNLVKELNELDSFFKKKYSQKVQCTYENGYTALIIDTEACIKYEIVKEPFKIGEWDVEIKGSNLIVGCKSFDKYAARSCLYAVLKNGYDAQHCNSWSLTALRKQLKVDCGGPNYYISYEDAEKLLKFLNEAC